MKTHIDYKELPSTIIGAIIVALVVGLEYIWIDSLCIIQDSKEDSIESADFGRIYQEAAFTISATGVRNVWEGLSLGERFNCIGCPYLKQPKIRGFDTSDPKDSVLSSILGYVLSQIFGPQPVESTSHQLPAGAYEWIDPDLWERDINQSPTSERGW